MLPGISLSIIGCFFVLCTIILNYAFSGSDIGIYLGPLVFLPLLIPMLAIFCLVGGLSMILLKRFYTILVFSHTFAIIGILYVILATLNSAQEILILFLSFLLLIGGFLSYLKKKGEEDKR